MTGLNNMEYDSIVITSYLKRESLHRALLDHGIADQNIREIFAIRG